MAAIFILLQNSRISPICYHPGSTPEGLWTFPRKPDFSRKVKVFQRIQWWNSAPKPRVGLGDTQGGLIFRWYFLPYRDFNFFESSAQAKLRFLGCFFSRFREKAFS
jgi:hypothetical protein